MKHQSVSILLSTLALVGVAGLSLFPGGSCPPPAPAEATVSRAPADLPPVLEGPSKDVDAELSALWARIDELEVTLATLHDDQKALAKKVGPATKVLALFEQARPNLMAARLDANETAAIATLRNLVSAQAQIQATGRIDTDEDGTGEYAGFLEMSGAVAGRGARPLIPPVLSSAFKRIDANGVMTRSGYCFKVFLPDAKGTGVGEPQEGFADDDTVGADLAETTWCAYAWPEKEESGKRAFFVNQGGDITGAETRYVGPRGGPAAEAAFLVLGPGSEITGAVAIGTTGRDGFHWLHVN